jgi:large subunit ribosomal protein L23
MYFRLSQVVTWTTTDEASSPDFTVTLLRTPHLGPNFASFEVPLWFGKLDLKSYLQNLYDVETLHIRSFVVHQKVQRTNPLKKFQIGSLYQPTFKKKMTVQLMQPFMWPAEVSKKELNGREYVWVIILHVKC